MAKLCLEPACTPGSPDPEDAGCSEALPAPHGDEVQKQSPSILPWDVPRGTCPSRGREPTPRWLRRSPRHRRRGSYRTPSLQPDPGQAVFQGCRKTSGATNLEGGPARSA